MHERYIRAGADIITTNTFNTIRPALELSGYGDMVGEINIRAVDAALEARNRAAGDREVYIAGSVTSRVPVRNATTGAIHGTSNYGASLPTDELRAYCDEMVDILAESGVDLLLVENMWADNESRAIATEAAKASGLPVWVAYTASVSADDQTVLLRNPIVNPLNMPLITSGWRSVDQDMTLEQGMKEIASLNPDVMGIFHARLKDTTAAIEVMRDEWSGPIVAYPDAGRRDYTEVWQDGSVGNEESVEEFTDEAKKWVDLGAQVVGACCGFGVDYIKPLRDSLPDRIASPRQAA